MFTQRATALCNEWVGWQAFLAVFKGWLFEYFKENCDLTKAGFDYSEEERWRKYH